VDVAGNTYPFRHSTLLARIHETPVFPAFSAINSVDTVFDAVSTLSAAAGVVGLSRVMKVRPRRFVFSVFLTFLLDKGESGGTITLIRPWHEPRVPKNARAEPNASVHFWCFLFLSGLSHFWKSFPDLAQGAHHRNENRVAGFGLCRYREGG